MKYFILLITLFLFIANAVAEDMDSSDQNDDGMGSSLTMNDFGMSADSKDNRWGDDEIGQLKDPTDLSPDEAEEKKSDDSEGGI